MGEQHLLHAPQHGVCPRQIRVWQDQAAPPGSEIGELVIGSNVRPNLLRHTSKLIKHDGSPSLGYKRLPVLDLNQCERKIEVIPPRPAELTAQRGSRISFQSRVSGLPTIAVATIGRRKRE
jgi:hypothetical protein